MEYFPIKNITTYTSNWIIKARVVYRTPIRQLKGDTPFFYADIVDKHGDSIRIKFWGKAATKWDEHVEKGKVYAFSKGIVDLSNKKYNNTDHNYEIRLNAESTIEPVEDDGDITTERYHKILSLRDVNSMPIGAGTNFDVLCIIRQVGELIKVNTKAGYETSRRNLTIVDSSGYEMEVSLWGELTTIPILDDVEGKAVIISNLTMKEWQGARNCNTISSSDIKLATQESLRDKERLSQLEEWYASAKDKNDLFKTMKPQTQASTQTYEVTDIASLMNKSKGNFTITAKLRKIYWKNKDGARRLSYQSCPVCIKKVLMDEGSNKFKCISCGDAVVTPVNRYFFHCAFIDHSGKLSAQINSDIGEKMLGKPASFLEELDDEQLKDYVDVKSIYKDYKVSGYLKGNMYNGETRYQLNITKLEPLDYVMEAELLLDSMQITYDSVLNFLGISSEGSKEKKAKLEE
ncbi:hypothetical protein BgAZ_106160 [Babesia gibsoni]|uniref:Replication protein A subunit n=1 Tax=Babesia gibsoni TaxID=33632 RepID=A0AAD8PGE3_BABGI|nr:hypothetical protein BgAZ_106160 [Babesia gibsoni]